MDLAAALFQRICRELDLEPAGLVLHSDNGGPMKGATMLATLKRLGVVASFSRPHVSDDNPYSEALFRTLKYRPVYERARSRNPERRTGSTRSWERVETVPLNPANRSSTSEGTMERAA